MQTLKVLLTENAKVCSKEGLLCAPGVRLHRPILSSFPFLEHLWPGLLELPLEGSPIRLPFVACPGEGMAGHYHFDFQLRSTSPWAMLMTITCQTAIARRQQQRLQMENEQALYSVKDSTLKLI